MKCFGCNRKLEVGDRYIIDTSSGFTNQDPDSEVDGIIAELFGGHGDRIVFCEDCTVPGGDYLFEIVYGEEVA